MRAIVFANGDVRAADRADDDGAVGLSVDANGLGECRARVIGAHVIDVAVLRIALEVDEVEAAAGIELRLRVNAAVGNANGLHHRLGGARAVTDMYGTERDERECDKSHVTTFATTQEKSSSVTCTTQRARVAQGI